MSQEQDIRANTRLRTDGVPDEAVERPALQPFPRAPERTEPPPGEMKAVHGRSRQKGDPYPPGFRPVARSLIYLYLFGTVAFPYLIGLGSEDRSIFYCGFYLCLVYDAYAFSGWKEDKGSKRAAGREISLAIFYAFRPLCVFALLKLTVAAWWRPPYLLSSYIVALAAVFLWCGTLIYIVRRRTKATEAATPLPDIR